MDLNAINATLQDTIEVEITHPVTGEGGLFIEFGASHNPFTTRRVNNVIDTMRRRKGPTTIAQDEQDGINILLARMTGWRGMTNDGEEVPYSDEAARAIIGHPKSGWIRQQCLDKIGDPTLAFKV